MLHSNAISDRCSIGGSAKFYKGREQACRKVAHCCVNSVFL